MTSKADARYRKRVEKRIAEIQESSEKKKMEVRTHAFRTKCLVFLNVDRSINSKATCNSGNRRRLQLDMITL